MKGSEGLSVEARAGLEEGLRDDCVCLRDRELTTQQWCIPWFNSSDAAPAPSLRGHTLRFRS